MWRGIEKSAPLVKVDSPGRFGGQTLTPNDKIDLHKKADYTRLAFYLAAGTALSCKIILPQNRSKVKSTFMSIYVINL